MVGCKSVLLDNKYYVKKLILMGLYLILYQYLPANSIFFVLGATFPFLEYIFSRDDYLEHYPWELYLFYCVVIYSFFRPVDSHNIYLGLGYMVSRLCLYFKLKKQTL